jgi:hypothetical protein
LERLGGVLMRLGASESVLERLGGVLKRLGALRTLLKAVWPDTGNVEKQLVVLAFWSLGRFLEPCAS